MDNEKRFFTEFGSVKLLFFCKRKKSDLHFRYAGRSLFKDIDERVGSKTYPSSAILRSLCYKDDDAETDLYAIAARHGTSPNGAVHALGSGFATTQIYWESMIDDCLHGYIIDRVKAEMIASGRMLEITIKSESPLDMEFAAEDGTRITFSDLVGYDILIPSKIAKGVSVSVKADADGETLSLSVAYGPKRRIAASGIIAGNSRQLIPDLENLRAAGADISISKDAMAEMITDYLR